MSIKDNYISIRKSIPESVRIVVAAKQRTKDEVLEVIESGAKDIGENYVQEAEDMFKAMGDKSKEVKWHMIGSLQSNKINKALKVFDVVQTVDSIEKAEAINKRAEGTGKDCIDVLLEVNIGEEESKSGAEADEEMVLNIAKSFSDFDNLKLCGIMTMGPMLGDPEESRPYFKEAKKMFDYIKNFELKNVKMETLSMGMSHSYKVAIEEGANMIRIGTAIFGPRKY